MISCPANLQGWALEGYSKAPENSYIDPKLKNPLAGRASPPLADFGPDLGRSCGVGEAAHLQSKPTFATVGAGGCVMLKPGPWQISSAKQHECLSVASEKVFFFSKVPKIRPGL